MILVGTPLLLLLLLSVDLRVVISTMASRELDESGIASHPGEALLRVRLPEGIPKLSAGGVVLILVLHRNV